MIKRAQSATTFNGVNLLVQAHSSLLPSVFWPLMLLAGFFFGNFFCISVVFCFRLLSLRYFLVRSINFNKGFGLNSKPVKYITQYIELYS
jgi:hypothetical protein